MKTGLVIYAASIERLTSFYTHVFGLEVIESDKTYALLNDGDFELVLLETKVSKKFIGSYEPKEATPLKPTFFIDSPLSLISEKIVDRGGVVYPLKNWRFGGRQVCDAYDCEGNIFQLRIGKNR